MSESEFPTPGAPWGGGHGIAATAKYNPHLWSAEELRAIFVVRQRELANILDAVRAVPAGGVAQHMLITGQRGMGKSTLLQRVALAVAEDAEVNENWLALRFPEEQYTVSTPGELWLNVIGALADNLERQGLPIEAIDLELAKLGAMAQVQREESALTWLEQWCQKQQKRLLLLMDSTDLLFSNLASAAANKRGGGPDGGATALWRVRKVLLHAPHFFWLGGSYQPLEARGLYSDAFLDFFQLIELRPLTLLEMQTAILALARTFGAGRGLLGEAAEQEVKRMLDERPERLRAMRQLTGGNPRTTITLYELFAAGGQESVRSDLERLLDVMTPLYKAKLEILADQMRKVLAHVMESWAPITAKGLADVSGISVGIVSAQLVRLEQEGLVEKVALNSSKRQGYQASERFFNIWYLMRNAARNARSRVGWLVEFMRLWYSKNELQDLAKIRWREHRDGMHCDFAELEYSRAIARAMPKAEEERRYLDWVVFRSARNASASGELFDLHGEDSDYSTPDDYLARLEVARELLYSVHLNDFEKLEWINEVISALHLTLSEKESIARKCGDMSLSEIVKLRSELSGEREQLVKLHNLRSIEQLEFAVLKGNFFPDCPDSKLALTQIETCFGTLPDAFAACLGRLGNHQNDELVESACKKAISLAPSSARPWNSLGHFLQKNGRYDEAVAAFKRAFDLAPEWATPWLSYGDFLQNRVGKYEEAEFAYRKAIELEEKDEVAWYCLGYLLANKLNRLEEAEQAYKHVIKLSPTWALPWAGIGALFQYKMNRYEEAKHAYLYAIKLDAFWPEPWGDLGNLLQYKLNLYEDAEHAYRQVINLAPEWARPWGDLGDLLQNKMMRYDEAELAYLKVIDLEPSWAQPWTVLGNLLERKLGRLEDAEKAYLKAISLAPESAELWRDLGNLLHYKMNRIDEAESAYRRSIELDPTWPSPWGDLGNLFKDSMDRFDDAEDAYRRVIEISSEWAQPWMTLGILYRDNMNRFGEAEFAFRRAIELNLDWAEPWYELGNLLQYKLIRHHDAKNAYERAIELDSSFASPWLGLADLYRYVYRDVDATEHAIRRAVKLAPTWCYALEQLYTLLCGEMRCYEEGQDVILKLIELIPDSVDYWNWLGELLQNKLKRYDEAERAYKNGIKCSISDPFLHANLGRLYVLLKRNNEANVQYQLSLKASGEFDCNLRLQAYCWLGIGDMALHELNELAEKASNNIGNSFFRLKEQCNEIYSMGLGIFLRDLMENSPYFCFLQPFALALRIANGENESLLDAPAEVRSLAEDILLQITD